jgi:PhnB protein
MAKTVKAIPDGYHTITPSLVVAGGAKAIEFYKKAFGAEELFRMPGPDGKSVMHAELQIGNSRLMLTDEFKDRGCLSPQSLGGSPVTIFMYVQDVDASFKRAVDAGAKVTMPLMDMFWGDRFGTLSDPFGHHWSMATHKEDVPPEEMPKRAQAAMAKMGEKPGEAG